MGFIARIVTNSRQLIQILFILTTAFFLAGPALTQHHTSDQDLADIAADFEGIIDPHGNAYPLSGVIC